MSLSAMHMARWAFVLLYLIQSPLAAWSHELQWPYNLPAHVKYYPEDETMVKRDMDTLQKLRQHPVAGLKKMSGDPGEKFYLDYWSFDLDDSESLSEGWANDTTFGSFDSPLLLHTTEIQSIPRRFRRYFALPYSESSALSRRDFTCPTGTESCSSVDRPDICCPSGSTCQIVSDTGLGDVGCCDAAQTCAGSLSQCPSGYSSCPNNPGGGCCLPNYACYEQGCVLTSTTVVIVTPTSTSSSSSTSAIVSTATATTIVVVTPSLSSASPATTTTSTIASVSPSATTTTQIVVTTSTSTIANTLVCSTGYRSCPASLGGGCCPTDRACGSDVCPEVSTSASLGAPVRPTTDTTTVTSTATSLTTSSSVVGCPTGFYACSAYYQGGCCQVGRDCAKTSCPASASTTVVNSDGITAVAPTGTYLPTTTTLLTGSCASGWSTCAATVGGGCCPSGYACGTAACSATASGQDSQVGKLAPNGGGRLMAPSALMILCGLFGMSIAIIG